GPTPQEWPYHPASGCRIPEYGRPERVSTVGPLCEGEDPAVEGERLSGQVPTVVGKQKGYGGPEGVVGITGRRDITGRDQGGGHLSGHPPVRTRLGRRGTIVAHRHRAVTVDDDSIGGPFAGGGTSQRPNCLLACPVGSHALEPDQAGAGSDVD